MSQIERKMNEMLGCPLKNMILSIQSLNSMANLAILLMRVPQFKFLPIIDFENILILFFETINTYTKLAEVGHT